MTRLALWFAGSAIGRGIIFALMVLAGLLFARARTRADAVEIDRATGYGNTRRRIDEADISDNAGDAREWLSARDPRQP